MGSTLSSIVNPDAAESITREKHMRCFESYYSIWEPFGEGSVIHGHTNLYRASRGHNADIVIKHPEQWVLGPGSLMALSAGDSLRWTSEEHAKGTLFRDGEVPYSTTFSIEERHVDAVRTLKARWVMLLLELPSCNIWSVCTWKNLENCHEVAIDEMLLFHPSENVCKRVADILSGGCLIPSPYARVRLVESPEKVRMHPSLAKGQTSFEKEADNDWVIDLLCLHANELMTAQDIEDKFSNLK